MSYNISTFKVKELTNLVIPVASLFKSTRTDWHPKRIDHPDGSVTFKIAEGCFLGGEIIGDHLSVMIVDCAEEASGTCMHLIFEPAFQDSTGKLVASCVWEGGDSINKLTVDNGAVIWEDIDI